jgi:hypothetical protein
MKTTLLAFVHIEKCGGTTVLKLLRSAFGLDHFDVIPRDKNSMLFGPEDLRELLALRPSVKSISGHTVRHQSQLETVVPEVQYYTVLRDPVARYVSDFRHFVDILGFPDDFEYWLDFKDRHDFQTKAIAGVDDVEEAKRILGEHFVLVGILEDFGEFLAHLRVLAQESPLSLDYEVSNTASGRRSKSDIPNLEALRERVLEKNRLDMELYEFTRSVLIPEQKARFQDGLPASPSGRVTRMRERSRLCLNRLYRNFVYKPYMGYAPFKYHALPPYRAPYKKDR